MTAIRRQPKDIIIINNITFTVSVLMATMQK